jgi:ribosome-associated protein
MRFTIKTHPSPLKAVVDIKKELLASLEDSKAKDIVTIDLHGKSDMADFMLIASGTSDRHVSAIADHLTTYIKEHTKASILAVEGLRDANWVLVDTGDIIVHIFRPEVRTFYNLEKMWAVEHVSVPEMA